jgi:hypothetical protein
VVWIKEQYMAWEYFYWLKEKMKSPPKLDKINTPDHVVRMFQKYDIEYDYNGKCLSIRNWKRREDVC